MASMSDDCDAQLRMLLAAYRNLQERDSTHDLLKHGVPESDWCGITWNASFYEKFERRDDIHNIQALGRYTTALNEALSR